MMVISVPVTTGGKNRSSLMKIGAIRKVKTPGDDHRAVDVEQARRAAAVGQPDRDDRRDAGERDALQQRQPDADLPEPDGLDDRRDAAGEQVGGDELDQVLAAAGRSRPR